MSEHFDDLETRDPHERDETLFARLPSFIERAIKVAPGWKTRLADVDPHTITSREALAGAGADGGAGGGTAFRGLRR